VLAGSFQGTASVIGRGRGVLIAGMSGVRILILVRAEQKSINPYRRAFLVSRAFLGGGGGGGSGHKKVRRSNPKQVLVSGDWVWFEAASLQSQQGKGVRSVEDEDCVS